MVLLPTLDRQRISAHFQRVATGDFGFTKPQLIAAVNAADQWADDNQASYNQALPVAFRNSATTAQKTLLLMFVMMRRMGWLRVDEDSG